MLAEETGQKPVETVKLIAPMLVRVMATDRTLRKATEVCKQIGRIELLIGYLLDVGVVTSVLSQERHFGRLEPLGFAIRDLDHVD